MVPFKKSSVSFLVFGIAIFLLVSLACGGSTAEQLASAVPSKTTTSQVEVGAPPTSEQKTSEPLAPPQATEEKPTPSAKPEAITVESQGMGQDGRELGYGFVVNNPNENYAIENSKYQVAIYNADGTVIETDSGYLELILPKQQLGVAGTVYIDEGVTASTINIQINPGQTQSSKLVDTFSVDKVVYNPGDYSTYVYGAITNPYDKDLESLRVSALLYNDANEIIGGGYTYLNFILANSTTGIKISTVSNGDVATVELFPALSSLSTFNMNEELPSGSNNLILTKQGFGQDRSSVGVGFIVENPNENFSVDYSMYHVTAYSNDGTIVGYTDGYINLLLPNQTLGVSDSLYLNEGQIVDSIDVQMKAGDFSSSEILPTFTSENTSFLPDQYSPEVTGEIVNPYSKDITNIEVIAICYNEAGEIIGSGYTYLDFIPADSKAAASVNVTIAGTPATVELYAAVTSLSDIEESP